MSVLSAYALVTLSDFKSWIGETGSSNDTLYERSINQATGMIERYIGRRVKARDYVFWLDSFGQREVKIPEYPVNWTNFVGYGAKDAIAVTGDPGDLEATVSVGPTAASFLEATVRLQRVPTSGTVPTVSTLDSATYPRMSSMASAIDAVTGFDAEVVNDGASRRLHRSGPLSVIPSAYRLTMPDDEAIEWRMDAVKGVLYVVRLWRGWLDDWEEGTGHRIPREWQSICVECNAGFSTIPDDLQQTCMTLAKQLYENRSRDFGVGSESLGDYSYTLRSPADALTTMEEMLAGWKEIR